MRSAIVQVFFLALLIRGEILKRSPLEVGLVTFPPKPHPIANVTIPTIIKSAHGHRWIPGHVRHHSYIPAHLGHIYIPTQALLLDHAVETVYVHPEIYSPYRQHYGGFGIGVDVGGQGAGHGFHVLVNF